MIACLFQPDNIIDVISSVNIKAGLGLVRNELTKIGYLTVQDRFYPPSLLIFS